MAAEHLTLFLVLTLITTPNILTSLVITLVMLVWGVASEALRDIITGFLDQVRFD